MPALLTADSAALRVAKREITQKGTLQFVREHLPQFEHHQGKKVYQAMRQYIPHGEGTDEFLRAIFPCIYIWYLLHLTAEYKALQEKGST